MADMSSAIRDAKTRWQRLSPLARRAITVAVALEGVLIAAVQHDIHHRPAERIRGPKLLWRIVGTQNVVGPIAYLTLGRRRGR